MDEAQSDADAIASLVLAEFEKLPQKRKPSVRDNGLHEWVPLSGIIARAQDGVLQCLSLATGMKCLPATKLPLANGIGLHDWHAETLAIRAFNHFALAECRDIALHGRTSPFLRLRSPDERAASASASAPAWHGQPFAWRDGVSLHMYCSEAPCGDASMELTMDAQADASPWAVPTTTPAQSGSSSSAAPLPGRAYFSRLGIVRRKPARPDAPPTLSKSCSDKLALRQCTSLLSSLAALLISPERVYLASLVLPAAQYSAAGCARAFSAGGRMRDVAGRAWPGGYAFAPFRVEVCARDFAFSRRSVALRAGCGPARMAASNLAVAWVGNGRAGGEGLVGGVLQGRRQFEPRGAGLASRRRLWGLALEVARLLGAGCVGLRECLEETTYRAVKEGELLVGRRRVKEDATERALAGWSHGEHDDDFTLGSTQLDA